MIKYQDLLGKTAYSLEEGRQWGKVAELFVDKKTFAVTGMVIRGEEDRFLFLKAAKKIDESIVFQSASDFMSLSSAEPGAVRGSKITGLRVMTEQGNEEGTVVSFYFKPDTGAITHYEFSKSVMSENMLMAQDGLVRMGDDAMIITEEAAEVAEEMKTKDNLRKTIAELGKKAGAFAAGAKESMKAASAKYGPGIKSAADNMGKGAKEAADKYGPKIREGARRAGEKVQELADRAKPKIKEAADKYGPKIKDAADRAVPRIKEAGAKAKDAVKKAWNSISKKKDTQ
jgi:sporulation protein YlmC with PRC-barrel domain